MSPRVARRIAQREHRGQRTRFGDPVADHVERVAAAVPAQARATALLHDLFELTSLNPAQLHDLGLTPDERVALELLTRNPDESYDTYVLRIVEAPGAAGQLARTVKLADLDDHLAHGRPPRGAPPYARARRRLVERVGLDLPTLVAPRGRTRAA